MKKALMILTLGAVTLGSSVFAKIVLTDPKKELIQFSDQLKEASPVISSKSAKEMETGIPIPIDKQAIGDLKAVLDSVTLLGLKRSQYPNLVNEPNAKDFDKFNGGYVHHEVVDSVNSLGLNLKSTQDQDRLFKIFYAADFLQIPYIANACADLMVKNNLTITQFKEKFRVVITQFGTLLFEKHKKLKDAGIEKDYPLIDYIAQHGLAELKNQETIDISSTGITSLTGISLIPGMANVKNLYTNGNNLIGLADIENMKSLEVLEAGGNKISAIAPDVLPSLSNLKELSLNNNMLNSLQANTLSGNQQLQTLDLSYNNLTSIDAGIFSSTQNLANLILNNNKINSIKPGTFKNMGNVKLVDLSNNELTNVDFEAFAGAENMEWLDLNSNKIQSIQPAKSLAINNLTSIDLANNQLSAIPANSFSNFIVLQDLNLGKNNIASISPDSFNGLESLEQLTLAGNELTQLGANYFAPLSSLETLNVNDNKITSIDKDALSGLSALRNFYFSDNDLTESPVVTYQNVPTLKTVSMSGNKLSQGVMQTIEQETPEIEYPELLQEALGYVEVSLQKRSAQPGLQNVPGAQNFDLYNGGYIHQEVSSALEFGMFSDLPDPEQVKELLSLLASADQSNVAFITNACAAIVVQYNIDTSKANLSDTAQLFIAKHKRLSDIGAQEYILADYIAEHGLGDFNGDSINISSKGISSLAGLSEVPGIEKIKKIIATDNHLIGITGLKNLNNLEKLNLDGNSLFNISPDSLSALGKLKTLSLADNLITKLVPNTFAGTPNLEKLNLDTNELGEIPSGIFSNTPKLKEIVLSNNQINTLPAGAFSDLSVLEDLSLADNGIKIISSGAFSGLNILKSLNLSANNITSIDPQLFSGTPFLNQLHLDQNQIKAIPVNAFANLSLLEDLDLSQNKIAILEPGSFSGLSGLEVLSLSDNEITQLSANIFQGLEKLITLNLQSNIPLKSIEQGAFKGLSTVENVLMHRCGLVFANVKLSALDDLTNLKQIDLFFVPLTQAMEKEVDQYFANKPNVVYNTGGVVVAQ